MTDLPPEDVLACALERAVDEGTLRLCYQPKLSFASRRVTGVEALMRWSLPEVGPISPSHFIPLAERRGLIDALSEWGLLQALRQWRRWAADGIELELAFNISPTTLRHMDVPDAVERWCRAVGVPTRWLTLELTEGATQDAVRMMDTLSRFRIKGVRVALDDFGTGYSSLLQLRQLPFSELKIDRWFVEDSTRSSDAALVIRSIIDLAHGLGLSVTAEGVATAEQFTLLRRFGCDQAQGQFVGPPLAGEALPGWLMRHRGAFQDAVPEGAPLPPSAQALT